MQYHQLNQEIKKECYKAKEKWLEKECQKLEKHRFDAKEMFKKIARHKLATASTCIKAKMDTFCMIQKMWLKDGKNM